MPEQNTITGPDRTVFRPREVPTGLESHVKFVVREYELFNLELERMVQSCHNSRRDEEKRRDRKGGKGSELLGQILALGSRHFDSIGYHGQGGQASFGPGSGKG